MAPGGDRARVLSDVGQDLVVDLATGVATDGPGLRRERDGAMLRPAADMTPDGSLVGVQLNPDVLVRELARGTTTMAQLPLAMPPRIPAGEPLSFSLGSDGHGYVIAVATELQRVRQSILTVIDPSTGNRAAVSARGIHFFGRRIDAFTALGQVAPDRTPPRARIRLPLRVSARVLLNQRLLPLRVDSNEAGQVTVAMQVRGRSAGFTFDTRDTPGRYRFTHFAVNQRDKARIRAAVGARLRLRISVSDFKGNSRRVVRTVRLIR